MSDRCDVVIEDNQTISVNGTRIGRVTNVDFSVDPNGKHLTIEATPTSLIIGQIPNETVDALMEDRSDSVPEGVDINRALARAAARGRGIDPDAHTRPSRAVPDSPETSPRPALKKRNALAEAEAAPTCGKGIGGGENCYRPQGHTGNCRS